MRHPGYFGNVSLFIAVGKKSSEIFFNLVHVLQNLTGTLSGTYIKIFTSLYLGIFVYKYEIPTL